MSDVETNGNEPPRPAVVVRPGRRRIQRNYRRIIVGVISGSLVVVGALTAVGTSVLWNMFNDLNVVSNVDDKILIDRPDKIVLPDAPHQPMNILVMGTDSRDCSSGTYSCGIDQESGGNASDTTILLHLSADRKRAYGVSVPRDSLVSRPDCTTDSGGVYSGGDRQMWNAAYSVGGPACTVAQFELSTGIAVDDFVVVDFASFQAMVDAVGGVEVCIPETIDDREHGIYLPSGTRVLDGPDALKYVRVRHIGDGSDIGRIKRQQAFIASMVHTVLSSNTLSDPVRVIRFLKAATDSLTVSEGLGDIRKLASLGIAFKDIGFDKVQFITVPWMYDAIDPNRVAWAPSAPEFWDLINHDNVLPKSMLVGKVTAGGTKKKNKDNESSGQQQTDQVLEAAGLCV
ncbi:MAG: LCP family protein [Nocardioides sp.]